jgi:hypothetical protein
MEFWMLGLIMLVLLQIRDGQKQEPSEPTRWDTPKPAAKPIRHV